MAGGLGGGLEVGQTSVAPDKGTATGGDVQPDKVVLSRDQLRVNRERWPRGEGYAERRSAGEAG